MNTAVERMNGFYRTKGKNRARMLIWLATWHVKYPYDVPVMHRVFAKKMESESRFLDFTRIRGSHLHWHSDAVAFQA